MDEGWRGFRSWFELDLDVERFIVKIKTTGLDIKDKTTDVDVGVDVDIGTPYQVPHHKSIGKQRNSR